MMFGLMPVEAVFFRWYDDIDGQDRFLQDVFHKIFYENLFPYKFHIMAIANHIMEQLWHCMESNCQTCILPDLHLARLTVRLASVLQD